MVFCFLLVDIDQLLVQDAENAVRAAVDFLDAFVFAGFGQHSRQRGVDDRGRAARLANQQIPNQFSHK